MVARASFIIGFVFFGLWNVAFASSDYAHVGCFLSREMWLSRRPRLSLTSINCCRLVVVIAEGISTCAVDECVCFL